MESWAARTNSVSASSWWSSRALKKASQAPLSTKTRSGLLPAAVGRGGRRDDKGFLQVAVEVAAEVGRKAIDHSARAQQRIRPSITGHRPNRRTDCLRFRPTPG